MALVAVPTSGQTCSSHCDGGRRAPGFVVVHHGYNDYVQSELTAGSTTYSRLNEAIDTTENLMGLFVSP